MSKISYTPAYVGDPGIATELVRIAGVLNSLKLSQWQLVYAEPEKPRMGDVCLADGAIWDPVSTGEITPVWFDGSAWVELGSGSGGVGPQGPQGPAGPQGPEASPIVEINLQAGTSYVLVADDAGKCIEMTSSSANSVQIPAGLFAVGMQLQVRQAGTGQTSITAAGGVTIRTPATSNVRAQWGTIALHQRNADEWILMGDLA